MNLFVFFRNICQLMLAPSNGWRDVARDDYEVEDVTSRGLYPLLAVMLLSVFVRPFYGALHFDLIHLLQTALVEFVALFVALFAGRSVMENILPGCNSTGERDSWGVGTVAVYVIGLMAVIQIFENLLPVELPVMQLLPAFAAVILWKSADFLEVKPSNEMYFMLVSIAALILPAVAINLIMSYLIS